jgi:hypothetical protein
MLVSRLIIQTGTVQYRFVVHEVRGRSGSAETPAVSIRAKTTEHIE